jgi:hypothetical protein
VRNVTRRLLFALALVLVGASCSDISRAQSAGGAAGAEQRVARIIGNATYPSAPLKALVVDNVPAGVHRLRARKDGHRESTREVHVAAGRRAEVLLDIEALTPNPVVLRSEDGAEMVLVPAGEFLMGASPVEVQEILAHCTRDSAAYCRAVDVATHASPQRRVIRQ